ncbi:MAG: hypothetical protein JXB88_21335, partial [Spirochaetales bacterium]|nr:hypothetical protein [Spirochaetales bacterium]
HEFHFVIAQSMRIRLEELDVFKGLHEISGIVVRILLLLVPVIKREHDWGKQRNSRYKYVSTDLVEKRVHTHAYLPEDLYRELKLIHQDLNFFSMAQIVRFFIEMFFELVNVYKEDVLKELESTYKRWRKEARENRLTLRQYIRQLMIIIQHLLPGKRIINIYNHHFMPFWRFRL